ncbi:MAG TPA: helix-turn-helix domain-containing protein [Candidatus Nitrosocosmicus sp.]|nr:helix-turn-helix domain-containing protein [Candidatus Nitrosocosmicus sp.]
MNDLQLLVKLGLTNDESRCYQFLYTSSSLTIQQISKEMNVLPNAVYRLINRLIDKGFVVELHTSPKTFQAIPPSISIENYVKNKQEELEKLRIQSVLVLSKNNKSTIHTKMEMLTGRGSTYKKFIELAETAKQEILVISIGEEVSDEIKLTHRDAIERGVSIKLLVHTYNKSNENILKNWIRMGTDVRHIQDSGYHLMIFDSNISIIVSNNPENTEERSGMVMYSEGLSKSLRDYFFIIWNRAIKIR